MSGGLSPLFSWRSEIVDGDLPSTTRLVALTLSLHMNERGGSCFPSHATLARETALNVDTVRDHLRRLVETGWLTKDVERSSARYGTRVYYTATVPQDVNNAVETSGRGGVDDPTPGRAVDPGGGGVQDPGPGGVLDPSQEDVREDVREQPPQPPASGGRRKRVKHPPEPLTLLERASDFDAWWQEYPRRIAKLDAVAAWRVMLGYLPNLDQLIAASHAIEKSTRDHHHDDAEWRRFIPYPSTWLRRGDYLDFAPSGEEPAPGTTERRPCVLCGVEQPCPERCRGVEIGRISDVEAECIWRST